MNDSERSGRWQFLAFLAVLVAVALGLIAVQYLAAQSMQNATQQATAETAKTIHRNDVDLEKAQQDLIAAQVANRTRNVVSTIAGQIGAIIATLVAVSGAMLALWSYLEDRRKERRDRAGAREKERQDRLATSLSDTLGRLVGAEPRQRMVGAAGLLSFLEPDKAEFHLQALSALIAAASVVDEKSEVRQSVRLGIERACRTVDPEILKRVSWHGVILGKIDLAKQNLSGLDLREANLENADLRGANFEASDLREAHLQGARLDGASLRNANLAYCDLAGAHLTGACLASAQLDGIKVLKADFDKVDLTEAPSGWRGVPWDVTSNWRRATFDAANRTALDAMYGKPAPDIRVLMLMWEIPPMVAGGTWTACYHLVRNLRRRGADVTVVVPWQRDPAIESPFGTDVEIVALGM